MTEQEAIDSIGKFIKELEEVNRIKYSKGINYFNAVGMSNLETKHSRFFVWLFSSDKPHNFMNNEAVTKLCEELYNYVTKGDAKTDKPNSNKTILKCSENDLYALIDGNISVTPELKIDTKNNKSKENRRYIDILIETSKAVFVIENKTQSDTHTDQLQAYQDYVNATYPNLRKIFIFLSPFGQLPYNNGGQGNYNSNWCVFDYKGILKIVAYLLAKVKADKINFNSKEQKEKLVILLEDYIEMVKTDILKESPAVRAECQKILNDKQLKETFEMLKDYIVNIASYENVLKYVKQWMKDYYNKKTYEANETGIKGNDPHENNIVICNEQKRSFTCYTKKMVDYFKSHGETDYLRRWRCYFAVGASDELRVFFQLYKSEKDSWSELQQAFISRYSLSVGKNQAAVEHEVSLSTPQDRSKFLENVTVDIDNMLEEKVIVAIKSFENKLLNL